MTPGVSQPSALISELGPVKPVSGVWQEAQAYPEGLDRVESYSMYLPSCSTGVSATMFGGNGGGGTGPTTAPPPETMFGKRRIPPANAHAAVVSEPAMTNSFLIIIVLLDSKCVEYGPSH